MTPLDPAEGSDRDPVAAADPVSPEPAAPPVPAGPERSTLAVRIAIGVVVVLALAALFWPASDGSYRAPGGTPLDAGGRPAPLGARLAPVTLLHFWATWCPPCIVEIPQLRALADELASDHRFAVVMVAVENDSQQVNDFLGPAEAAQVLYDPQWEVAKRYGTRQLPETYLIVDGEVVEKFVGATNWTDPQIAAKVRQHLD